MTASVRGSTWRKRFCFVSETRSVLELKFQLRNYMLSINSFFELSIDIIVYVSSVFTCDSCTGR